MKRVERIATLAAIGLVVAGCLVVLRPFISAILWAAVLCYCTWPVFARLDRVIRHRSRAALLMLLLFTVVLVAPFLVVGINLAENVARIGQSGERLAVALPPDPPSWVVGLPVVGRTAAEYWETFARDTERLSRLMGGLTTGFGKWVLRHSLDFGKGLFELIISVLVAFVFYRDGERIVSRVREGGRRIAGDSTQHLLELVGNTVRAVVYGIIGTGLAQGCVAALGFWIAGVPSPVLLGLLTFLLSFLPVGPVFVWLPVCFWLYQGHGLGWALFMAVWGTFGISGVDNFLRPFIISRLARVPFIITLLGVIGGILAFGFIGIFLGPTLLAVGHCLALEYAGERSHLSKPLAAAATPAGSAGPETEKTETGTEKTG
jgi:predicted PurR-regulated permease PerM